MSSYFEINVTKLNLIRISRVLIEGRFHSLSPITEFEHCRVPLVSVALEN